MTLVNVELKFSQQKKNLKPKILLLEMKEANFFYIMNYCGFFPSYVVDATHYYAVDIFWEEVVDVVMYSE